MSAHVFFCFFFVCLFFCYVLFQFIKRVGESDKMRGLSSILFFFRNEFNKFNNTGARVLDSIYHMALNLLNTFAAKYLKKPIPQCQACFKDS